MNRKDELVKIITKAGKDNDIKAAQLIDEVIFLEERLVELKKLPFIRVSKKNPAVQETTPASRQYKELLQQYNNSLRLLFRLSGDMGESEETSPLRDWMRKRLEDSE